MTEQSSLLELVAMCASISMPLFNIPLIIRIVKRKSADDISLVWLLGVYCCIFLMFPYGVMSDDIVLKAFSISNFFLFSVVVFVCVWYRIRKQC